MVCVQKIFLKGKLVEVKKYYTRKKRRISDVK